MIAALLFLLACILFGTSLFGKRKENVVFGIIAGSAIGSAVVFVVSLLLGFSAVSVTVSALLLYAAFLAMQMRWRVAFSMSREVAAVFVFALLFFFISAFLVFHVDGVPRGVRIDFGFHHSIISSIANGNFPPSNPLLAGEPLRYYFLPHLFSAALVAGGFGQELAFWAPFALWNAALVALVFLLCRGVLGSTQASLLALALFFLNGSFAFIPYLQSHDVLADVGAFLQNPSFLSDYRFVGYPFENILVSQNFFTFSFALGFCVLLLLVFSIWERWDFRLTGFLAGLLPLVHLPSFVLWALFAVPYALLFDRRKEWLRHFAVAGIVAAPSLLFLAASPSVSSIKLHFGWMAPDPSFGGVVLFWLGNIGVVLLFALAGLLSGKDKFLRSALLASIPAFLVGNMVLVAPNPWDNVKLFLLSFLVLCILAAGGLARLWEKGVAFKALCVAGLLLATFTGFLHIATIFAHSNDDIFLPNDWAACKWLGANIPTDALLLTDGANTCASALEGRRVFVGPLEWLQNHGLDYGRKLAENDAMLAGDCALLERDNVTHFYDGGYLGRGAFINRTFWESQETVYDSQGVSIYQVRC